MERILFGDNQFFGVNHMSEEKARSQAIRFQNIEEVIEVLDIVHAEDIKVFMCTTHDRVYDICEHFRKNSGKYQGFMFYPCMPYAHKYANAVTEYGMIESLKRFLPRDGLVGTLFKGGKSLLTKDIEGITQLLVDAEMKMFHGLHTPIIFLQNVMTDLLLGLGFFQAFRFFADHVKKAYNAEPGFITMNLPALLNALEEVGIENPIICSNINKIGFRMCGDIGVYEKLIKENKFRPIAMSVFASGALQPRDALQYVCRQTGIKSIVFGASSRANIIQTKKLIEEITLEYS